MAKFDKYLFGMHVGYSSNINDFLYELSPDSYFYFYYFFTLLLFELLVL